MGKQVVWFVVLMIIILNVGSESIRWRINLPDVENIESSTATSFPFTIPSVSDQPSKIRLVDWREWKRMRPSYSATIGAPPLLIVDSSLEQKSTPLLLSEIPEAFDEDGLDSSSSTESTKKTTTSSSSTTTTQIPSTTTQLITTTLIESNLAEENEKTTTQKHMPDVTFELKNLPDILSLLKHLSLIPAVVRSFSNAAITSSPNTDSFPSFASNQFGSIISPGTQQQSGLNSRALSANSGYNARAPQFVTASPADSERPETFIGRRPSQLLPNMPAPIVPVNNRQEAMKPREIGNSIRDLNNFPPSHRLNIYGIDSQPARESPVLERNHLGLPSYTAPMIETPQNIDTPIKKQRPRFDLSNLTVSEVEQLESIHRKLFQNPPNLNSTNRMTGNQIDNIEPKIQQPSPLPLSEGAMNPVFVFEKPTHPAEKSRNSISNELMATTSSINSSLKPEMLNELMMIKDIPDLEELTKGMDLSLLSKPGGFALLKEQFIERLVQRTLVQKRRMRKMHRNRKH